jgi:hypothetical protein
MTNFMVWLILALLIGFNIASSYKAQEVCNKWHHKPCSKDNTQDKEGKENFSEYKALLAEAQAKGYTPDAKVKKLLKDKGIQR